MGQVGEEKDIEEEVAEEGLEMGCMHCVGQEEDIGAGHEKGYDVEEWMRGPCCGFG